MRTRTRTDSPVGQRLDLSWDAPSADDAPTVESPSAAEAQEPQSNSTAPSETASPIKSSETSPASSTSTEDNQLLFGAPENGATPTSPAEAASPIPSTPAESSPAEGASNPEGPTPPITEAASTESPSPALLSQPSHEPSSANPPEEPSATVPQEQINASTADNAPEEPPAKAAGNTPATPRIGRKPAPPVNIIPKNERVGVVLARKREEANVKIEDLAKRLNINSFVITYLESGDYEGLKRTFGKDNCIYIIFNFKSIGEELGMSKNEIDDLVEKLTKEIEVAGLSLDAPVKHDDDVIYNPIERKRPVKSVLPKLIVFTLFIICLIIFFLAVVVPYVSRIRHGTEKRLDFLPLIEQPWRSPAAIPPQQIPVP